MFDYIPNDLTGCWTSHWLLDSIVSAFRWSILTNQKCLMSIFLSRCWKGQKLLFSELAGCPDSNTWTLLEMMSSLTFVEQQQRYGDAA